jgi:hypothetical protein
MRYLDKEILKEVSGSAYVTADYVSVVTPGISTYEHMTITFTTDGSLPPEFQKMIDDGASWEQMAPWLTMYSMIMYHNPELFQ